MEGKQRLRPWLEAQISGGEIPGLCWINDEKTKFKIPWKHGGKHDWIPDSGLIFKVRVMNFFASSICFLTKNIRLSTEKIC